MNEDDAWNMFVRQRRNLMGISIIVLFVTYSGLQFSELNLLGNKFVISNPHIVNYALWIAFIYWTLRYFQYMRKQGGTGIYSTYAQDILRITSPIAMRELEKLISEKMGSLAYQVNYSNYQWISMPSMFNPFFRRQVKFYYAINLKLGNGNYKHGSNEEEEIVLARDVVRDFGIWAKVIGNLVFRTPLITEYIVPPLLAFSVVIAAFAHYLVRG